MNERPDPDQLLKRVVIDEESAGHGRLKLFFGASPGVGKTYAMLEAARQRQKEGWDVVVGVVETHGRAETEALLNGLAILPRRDVDYKGIGLQEFDIDAALQRRPTLIVIDELAHTNAPGSRHAKRWQDVEELLDAGIQVYTTLNVQHWESLNDVVAQITGVAVRETVPDTFLQRTHDLELVDLSPDELLKRLKEGKVYRDEQAERAAGHFFQPGNLIALRELALRHAAERVDAQMQAYKEQHGLSGGRTVGDAILVGVSSSPMSARLIRATHRMATRLHAPWTALHVETSAFLKLSNEEIARAIDNLRLAKRLGAQTETVTGEDVTDELLRYARKANISKLVLGKPALARWKEWLRGSVVNETARRCGNIDLYIISGVGSDFSARRGTVPGLGDSRTGYVGAVVSVVFCTLLSWPLSHVLDRVNLTMIYLLGISGVAYRFGQGPSVLCSLLSVLAFDFFFVPPYFAFAVSDVQYLFTFIVMLSVGLLIGTLTSSLRVRTTQIAKREERIRGLYTLSRELSETSNPNKLPETAQKRLEEFYGMPVILVMPRANHPLTVAAGNPGAFGFNDLEAGVAQWVFDHNQMAGAGTETLSGSKALYLPLKGSQRMMGVLGLKPAQAATLQDPEQLQLLENFASEIGGALESTRLTEAAGRAEMQMELLALAPLDLRVSAPLDKDFDEKRIVFLSPGQSRDQIIRKLVDMLDVPDHARAFVAIHERELIASTLLDKTIAVPHARLMGLDRVHAALGISRDGPIHLWIVFLGPLDDAKAHLLFLRRVAAYFQDKGRQAKIRKCKTPKEVLASLSDGTV